MSQLDQPGQEATSNETATLGAGCFWCIHAACTELRGVSKVVSGYAGGHDANPTYHQVCEGTTGHAEVVQVTFDPSIISFRQLLQVFFTIHDPTTLNRQGADVGTQYRSAIFYENAEQKRVAEEMIVEISAAQIWPNPIVTQVAPLDNFYPAEPYHQDYFKHNPNQGYCQVVIAPKVAKFRKHFATQLKK